MLFKCKLFQSIWLQFCPQIHSEWTLEFCFALPVTYPEGLYQLLDTRKSMSSQSDSKLKKSSIKSTDSFLTLFDTAFPINVVARGGRGRMRIPKSMQNMYNNALNKPWKAGKSYNVVAYAETNNEVTQDEDCQRGLGAAWNELQLLRLEETSGQNGKVTRELFLGDLHTDLKRQEQYRPTGYQPPLIMAKHQSECAVCQMVTRSSERSPAHLHAQPALPPLLAGSWASPRCETRPYGMFLTRHLTFSPSSKEWVMTLRYYHATGCYRPSFSVQARGTYVHAQPLPYAYDFLVKVLLMTPEDETMAEALNAYKGKECGRPGQWFVGRSQDLTPTGGCASVGVRVPLVEREILMMGTDSSGGIWLRLGQTATSSQQLDASPRPTSWGPPLQQCRSNNQDDIDNSLQPMMGARTASHATKFSSTMIVIDTFCLINFEIALVFQL
ncbi:unnamed protein product, partial [Meganyctiphanes norvegica]